MPSMPTLLYLVLCVSIFCFHTLSCPVAAPRVQSCVLKSTAEEQRQMEKGRGGISDRRHQSGWAARKDKAVQRALGH